MALVIMGGIYSLFAETPECRDAKTNARLAWNGEFVPKYDQRREFSPDPRREPSTTKMLQRAAEACGKDPDRTDLAKWLGFEPTVIQAGAGTEAAVNQTRVRREWTEWVLMLVLLVLVGESVWAWVCGKAW